MKTDLGEKKMERKVRKYVSVSPSVVTKTLKGNKNRYINFGMFDLESFTLCCNEIRLSNLLQFYLTVLGLN